MDENARPPGAERQPGATTAPPPTAPASCSTVFAWRSCSASPSPSRRA